MLITVRACFLGIGQGRVTSNLHGAPIDDAVFVSDKEAVEMVRRQYIGSMAASFFLFINFFLSKKVI